MHRGARTVITTAIACAAVLSPAVAETGSKGREFFISAYTGIGLTDDSDLHVRRTAPDLDLVLRQVSWEDYSLGRPSIPYIGVRGGFYFASRPWLGLGLDIFHFKVFAETDRIVHVEGHVGETSFNAPILMDRVVQQYDVANGINMALVNVLARKRLKRSETFPDGRVQPYGGLGIGPTWLYTHSTVLKDEREGYELGHIGSELLAGVQYRLNPRWDLFTEAKLTRTKAEGSIASGSSETTLDSRHLVVGVGRRF